MSIQETQITGEVAVAAGVLLSDVIADSVPEGDEQSQQITSTGLNEAPKDQGQDLPLSDVINDVAGADAKPSQQAFGFTPRDNTNFVIHRRSNKDQSFDFFLIPREEDLTKNAFITKKSEYSQKGSQISISQPVGVQTSAGIIEQLAKETNTFIDFANSEERPQGNGGDETDYANLKQLSEFVTQERSVYDILTKGVISINLGSVLIRRTFQQVMDPNNTDVTIRGMITIRYCVEERNRVYKYRLVGDIAKELITEICDAANPSGLMQSIFDSVKKQVTTAKAEPKQPKRREQVGNNQSIQNSDTPVVRRHFENSDMAISRLTALNEDLIVEVRNLNRKSASQYAMISELEQRVRNMINVLETILDNGQSNQRVLDDILKALSR